jgi:hypothetical protein
MVTNIRKYLISFLAVLSIFGMAVGLVACGETKVASVTISGADILKIGDSSAYTAEIAPSDAANKTVTWSVTGSGASIDNSGVLTVTAAGNVTVTAAAGGVTGTKNVKVEIIPATEIRVSDKSVNMQGSVTLDITTIPENATITDLTYILVENNIGAVLSGNTVTCNNIGQVTYKAEMNGVTSNTAAITFLLAETFTETGFVCKVVNETYIKITDYTGSEAEVTIPAEIQGLPVTEIAQKAFHGKDILTSLVIPDSITKIGQYAFGGNRNLVSITLPFVGETITSAGEYATLGYTVGSDRLFGGNYSYNAIQNYSALSKTYYFPNSLKNVVIAGGNISMGAFQNMTKVESITLPEAITAVGSRAFENCISINAISIPETVTAIGANAFYNCSRIETVALPAVLTAIGDLAFYDCDGIKSITLPNGLLEIGQKAFSGCSGLTNIVVPNTVTYIGQYAFGRNRNLISISLPFVGETETAADNTQTLDKATLGYTVGNNASFATSSTGDYSALQSSENPAAANPSVYWFPSSLKNITVNRGNIGNGAFQNMKKIENVTLPATFTTIGSYAFEECHLIESIIISDTVETIGERAFYNCDKLAGTLALPAQLKTIGNEAFSRCGGLTGVTLPDGLLKIGASAFSSCAKITEIIVPNSVTEIGQYAFGGCRDLVSITLPFVGETPTSAGEQAAFGYTVGNAASFAGASGYEAVQSSSASEYKTYYFSNTLTTVKISGGSIGYGAFQNMVGLRIVKIGDINFTGVGENAFDGCNSSQLQILMKVADNVGTYGDNWHGGITVYWSQNV